MVEGIPEFGVVMQGLRKKLGISGRKMSLAMGFNIGYMSYLECGKGPVTEDVARVIKKYLNENGVYPKGFFDMVKRSNLSLGDNLRHKRKVVDVEVSVSDLVSRGVGTAVEAFRNFPEMGFVVKK